MIFKVLKKYIEFNHTLHPWDKLLAYFKNLLKTYYFYVGAKSF